MARPNSSDMLPKRIRKDYLTIGQQTPQLDTQQDWMPLNSNEENGVTTLKFYRKRNTTDQQNDTAIPVGMPIYLVWAYDSSSDSLRRHKKDKNYRGFEQVTLIPAVSSMTTTKTTMTTTKTTMATTKTTMMMMTSVTTTTPTPDATAPEVTSVAMSASASQQETVAQTHTVVPTTTSPVITPVSDFQQVTVVPSITPTTTAIIDPTPGITPNSYYRIGCFNDTWDRAMPIQLGNWRHDSQALQKCALAAEKAGYSVFGVQYAGECWSGPQAHLTYKKYGSSTRCVNGTGGIWAQDVYAFVNASLIANYDIKRCYEVDITFHYQIPGGLTSNTINKSKSEFSDFLKNLFSNAVALVPECSGVIITREEITASPPGVTNIFFRVPIVFTASKNIPDDQVSSKLISCINTAKSNYKGFIDSSTPAITQEGVIHQKYNLSTISDKRSCCGGDIPPPCCAAGSIKVYSTKCGCVPGFNFVPSSFCVRCPLDTYQDEQGQETCKNCPGNKQTFGKTGMTSKSNCSEKQEEKLEADCSFDPHNMAAVMKKPNCNDCSLSLTA